MGDGRWATGDGGCAFASVVLDVDSTLAGIEGIDWLAQRRGADVAEETARLTERAMDGAIALEEVYGARLALIRPTREEIGRLAEAYLAAVAPGAVATIADLRTAAVRVVLVSGGIRQAIEPLSLRLGVPAEDLEAVSLRFDERGEYLGFEPSLLATTAGKPLIIRRKALPPPILAVGDGMTDVAMREVADRFGAFTGFVRREPVVRAADCELTSFEDLRRIAFPN
jgi:phosphoserine phosphatase